MGKGVLGKERARGLSEGGGREKGRVKGRREMKNGGKESMRKGGRVNW